jgi:predicted alpha/beta hydrolase family esterase
MKTAYIFHDAFCDPISDWYPWMKTTLEGMGYLVIVPKFPTPGGQSYDSWKAVMKNNLDKFTNETIFIGHGIGGTFALRLLEEINTQIQGTFLVASYTEALGHVGFDRVNETFTKHEFNWEKIKNNTHVIKIFAGENDPFVHTDVTERLADNLNTDPIVIPGGEHINKASGFTQCVQLAQGIKEGLREIDKSMIVEPVSNDPIEVSNSVRAADANSFAAKQEESRRRKKRNLPPKYLLLSKHQKSHTPCTKTCLAL